MADEILAERVEQVATDVKIVVTEIRELISVIRDGHAQERKDRNSSFILGASVVGCFACVILMVAFLIVENRSFGNQSRQMSDTKATLERDISDMKTHYDAQLDQLRAWREVQGNDIAALKAKTSKPQQNGR